MRRQSRYIGKHPVQMVLGIVNGIRYGIQVQFFGQVRFYIFNDCRNILYILLHVLLLPKPYYTQP